MSNQFQFEISSKNAKYSEKLTEQQPGNTCKHKGNGSENDI